LHVGSDFMSKSGRSLAAPPCSDVQLVCAMVDELGKRNCLFEPLQGVK